jgi:hypothetical protein
VLAFFYGTFIIGRTLAHGVDVPGYASIVVLMLFLGGVQLITLGVVGEYLGRTYEETKQRPVYIVRDCLESPEMALQAVIARLDREPRPDKVGSPAQVPEPLGSLLRPSHSEQGPAHFV